MPEQVLWRHLRGSQMDALKFRRQYGVGIYVLDFYCPALRLAIEIDGDSHYSEAGVRHDADRDKFLREQNIRIIRFTNNEVVTNIEGVLTVICSYRP